MSKSVGMRIVFTDTSVYDKALRCIGYLRSDVRDVDSKDCYEFLSGMLFKRINTHLARLSYLSATNESCCSVASELFTLVGLLEDLTGIMYSGSNLESLDSLEKYIVTLQGNQFDLEVIGGAL